MRVPARLDTAALWWALIDKPRHLPRGQLKAEGGTLHDEVLVGVPALSNPVV